MYNVAIITASDKGYAGEREDMSGQVIEDIALAKGLQVASKIILPDDRRILADEMIALCDQEIDLILTTGGTGFSKETLPEATADVVGPGADNLICYDRQRSAIYPKGHALPRHCRDSR